MPILRKTSAPSIQALLALHSLDAVWKRLKGATFKKLLPVDGVVVVPAALTKYDQVVFQPQSRLVLPATEETVVLMARRLRFSVPDGAQPQYDIELQKPAPQPKLEPATSGRDGVIQKGWLDGRHGKPGTPGQNGTNGVNGRTPLFPKRLVIIAGDVEVPAGVRIGLRIISMSPDGTDGQDGGKGGNGGHGADGNNGNTTLTKCKHQAGNGGDGGSNGVGGRGGNGGAGTDGVEILLVGTRQATDLLALAKMTCAGGGGGKGGRRGADGKPGGGGKRGSRGGWCQHTPDPGAAGQKIENTAPAQGARGPNGKAGSISVVDVPGVEG